MFGRGQALKSYDGHFRHVHFRLLFRKSCQAEANALNFSWLYSSTGIRKRKTTIYAEKSQCTFHDPYGRQIGKKIIDQLTSTNIAQLP
jgi:hypothetical protein